MTSKIYMYNVDTSNHMKKEKGGCNRFEGFANIWAKGRKGRRNE